MKKGISGHHIGLCTLQKWLLTVKISLKIFTMEGYILQIIPISLNLYPILPLFGAKQKTKKNGSDSEHICTLSFFVNFLYCGIPIIKHFTAPPILLKKEESLISFLYFPWYLTANMAFDIDVFALCEMLLFSITWRKWWSSQISNFKINVWLFCLYSRLLGGVRWREHISMYGP